MAPEQKIWKLSNANELPNLLGKQQSVLCYGHFNIIHPGHIRYLEYAKSRGNADSCCAGRSDVDSFGQLSSLHRTRAGAWAGLVKHC